MHLLDISLRAGGALMLMLTGALFLARSHGRIAGVMAALLAASVAAHLLCPLALQRWGLTLLTTPLLLACIAVPGVFWLFAQALFKDGFRLRAWHAAPMLALLSVGLVDVHFALALAPVLPMMRLASSVTAKLLALALIVSALVQVHVGRPSDLIEARRNLRGMLIIVSGAYMVVVIAVELYLHGEDAPPALSASSAGAIVVLALGIAVGLWRLGAGVLFPKPQPPRPDLDETDRLVAERLARAIDVDRIYRREGLTIVSLSEILDVQEHRLRRIINRHLGYRNFNDFLNRHRIRDACEALADAARSRVSVLTIALDLGYRSLSPFNRAFKEQTGVTPTQYRSEKRSARPLADSTPAS